MSDFAECVPRAQPSVHNKVKVKVKERSYQSHNKVKVKADNILHVTSNSICNSTADLIKPPI